jgi:hypothetical protein
MQSNNASSAENQQERQFLIGWIVGFVDGEGCFSISVIKNLTTVSGTQIFPEFVVTQGEKSLKSLEILKNYFDCGHIYVNRRNDNHRENLYRYCVRSQNDLRGKVIPFFEKNQLVTSKGNDFKIFKRVLDKMRNNEHLSKDGYQSILEEISEMNRKKKRN